MNNITVLTIEETKYLSDEHKDSAMALWEVRVSFLKGITIKPKKQIIVIKEASKSFIKTGLYRLIDHFKGKPVYEIINA